MFLLLLGLMFLIGVAGALRLPWHVSFRLMIFVTLFGEIVLFLPSDTKLLFDPTAWLIFVIFFLFGVILAGIPAIVLGGIGWQVGRRYLLPYLLSLTLSKPLIRLIGTGLDALTAGSLGLLARYLWAFEWRTISAFVAGGAVAGLIVASDLVDCNPSSQVGI